ncbi:MAG: type I-F CRISPR-associated protein Csy3 [Neisseria sp.]|nr:type I-F CRISPR-associated protein Csy3 [Neisseria sp.]
MKNPTVLAFERKLDISDAVFSQTDSKDPTQTATVMIREKSVRGTISNRLKNAISNDPVKLDTEIQKPNLQTVDCAALDDDKDTLIVNWSCKVLPFNGEPCVCNDRDYQAKLMQTVAAYLSEQGLSELSRRYALNIANARWLWRNRMGAETITVTVTAVIDGAEKTLTFDNAQNITLNDFHQEANDLNTLADWIHLGFKGEQFVLLNIEARLIVGYGQEVFPSQELILDGGNSKKSKILYQVNEKAAMHSQKIGNAIRTVDNWYPDAQFPIAAEPYGSVTTLGTAFRQPKEKTDFYTLFDDWMLKDKQPSPEQQHYVMAVLIRGGVFGASGKE